MVAINSEVNEKSVIPSKLLCVISFYAWEKHAYVCMRAACVFVEFKNKNFALKYLKFEYIETLCLARASKPIDQT